MDDDIEVDEYDSESYGSSGDEKDKGKKGKKKKIVIKSGGFNINLDVKGA